jgi:hypothetical protein
MTKPPLCKAKHPDGRVCALYLDHVCVEHKENHLRSSWTDEEVANIPLHMKMGSVLTQKETLSGVEIMGVLDDHPDVIAFIRTQTPRF